MRAIILTDAARDMIADELTVAGLGGDVKDAMARIVARIESSPVTVGDVQKFRDNPEHTRLLRAVVEHLAPLVSEFDKRLPLYDGTDHPVIADIKRAIGWRDA